jgi:leucyl aminopeptidase
MVKRILLFLLLSICCFAPSAASAAGETSAALPPDAGAAPIRAAVNCAYSADVSALLSLTSQADWAGWISRLSGSAPISVNGSTTHILTRYSLAMFATPPASPGYAYLREKLLAWYPSAQVQDEPYTTYGLNWKNLVLSLPGTTRSNETVILSAHLDSASSDPMHLAPGAEDNGSGSAALLEAARIFRTMRFERTLRLIWFTGEENGLFGSKAYVAAHSLSDITAVVNLDMYGYDADQDGCFEVHAGTQTVSAPIGECFIASVQAYNPTLKVDLINTYNNKQSDHAPFWEKGIGAVEVLENYNSGPTSDACAGVSDPNPWYHTSKDTLDKINLTSGFAITTSALATAASLAIPNGACFPSGSSPDLHLATPDNSQHILSWDALSGAQSYRIYRSPDGCSGDWQALQTTSDVSWTDQTYLDPLMRFAYRVEALGSDSVCASAPSACLPVKGYTKQQYFPWISH